MALTQTKTFEGFGIVPLTMECDINSNGKCINIRETFTEVPV